MYISINLFQILFVDLKTRQSYFSQNSWLISSIQRNDFKKRVWRDSMIMSTFMLFINDIIDESIVDWKSSFFISNWTISILRINRLFSKNIIQRMIIILLCKKLRHCIFSKLQTCMRMSKCYLIFFLNDNIQVNMISILTNRCLNDNALVIFKTKKKKLLLNNKRKIQKNLNKMIERMSYFRKRLFSKFQTCMKMSKCYLIFFWMIILKLT